MLGNLRTLFGRDEPAKPKVFGLGLSKTGTKTLGAALTQLGYRNKTYDAALLAAWDAGEHSRLFEVIDRYDCFDDWPFPLAFREIMDRFGEGARYVLTVRKDPQTWLASLKAHALRSDPDNRRLRRMAYGYEYPQWAEREHLEFYERHNQAVRDEVARRGLRHVFVELCWEKGDGWAELCRLLGEKPPRGRFPFANRTTENSSDPRRVAENKRRIELGASAAP